MAKFTVKSGDSSTTADSIEKAVAAISMDGDTIEAGRGKSAKVLWVEGVEGLSAREEPAFAMGAGQPVMGGAPLQGR